MYCFVDSAGSKYIQYKQVVLINDIIALKAYTAQCENMTEPSFAYTYFVMLFPTGAGRPRPNFSSYVAILQCRS